MLFDERLELGIAEGLSVFGKGIVAVETGATCRTSDVNDGERAGSTSACFSLFMNKFLTLKEETHDDS